MYHITDDGPRRCKATIGSCPYGKKPGSHFGDQQEAQKAYESKLVSEYGTMGASVARKVDSSPLQQKYRNQDRLKVTSPTYRAWSTYRDLQQYTPKQTANGSDRTQAQQSRLARKSKLNHLGKKLLNKNLSKFAKAATPNSRNMKKLLLVKYWMPDIHSNKWR